jgi:hypothetical protein
MFAMRRPEVGRRPIVAAGIALCAVAASWATPPAFGDEAGPTAGDYKGIFSLRSENDVFAGNDNKYTNGIALSWTTADVSRLEPDGFFSKVVRSFSFLPTVGDEGYADYVAFEVGQEMYTPEDISLPAPPPGDQPYAGVLFFDTKLYSKTTRSLHAYTFRVGIVGPWSFAEQTQRFLHRLNGAKDPQGWDTQLSNEPLLNLDYQYHRRLWRRARPKGFGYDVSANGGAGFGNYFIGGNVGALFRLGHSLPDTYGSFDIRKGGEALVGLAPSPTGWHAYLHLAGNGFAVARFLPTDGNTFKDSRSGDRDDFYAVITAGAVVGYKRLLFSYMYNLVVSQSSLPAQTEDDYGAIAMHWIF